MSNPVLLKTDILDLFSDYCYPVDTPLDYFLTNASVIELLRKY